MWARDYNLDSQARRVMALGIDSVEKNQVQGSYDGLRNRCLTRSVETCEILHW